MSDAGRERHGARQRDHLGGVTVTPPRPIKGGRATTRLTITEAAAEALTAWHDGLVLGEIPIWRLPGPVAAFYEAGLIDGARSRDHEVRTAKHEADRLWLIAFGDKEQRAYLLDRLDKVGELIAANPSATDDFLREVVAGYFASLDRVREPISGVEFSAPGQIQKDDNQKEVAA